MKKHTKLPPTPPYLHFTCDFDAKTTQKHPLLPLQLSDPCVLGSFCVVLVA